MHYIEISISTTKYFDTQQQMADFLGIKNSSKQAISSRCRAFGYGVNYEDYYGKYNIDLQELIQEHTRKENLENTSQRTQSLVKRLELDLSSLEYIDFESLVGTKLKIKGTDYTEVLTEKAVKELKQELLTEVIKN